MHRYENLLNRDFHAERPNQKRVTDISYIKTAQGFLYLSVIRDLYDSSIVAYKTSNVQNINLVLNTIRAAKRKEKVTGELQLHSDQGFQYTSQGYFKLTQSYNSGDARLFSEKPDKVVRVSDKKVQAFYGEYVRTITAEGEGSERHNFTITTEKGEVSLKIAKAFFR